MFGGLTWMPSLAGFALVVVLDAAGCRSSSEATARPTPPAAPPGTSWTLGVKGGTAPAAAIAAEPPVAFGSGGTLSGDDGCNNHGGALTTSGRTLAITGLKTTGQVEYASETVEIATAFRASLGAVTSGQATSADDVPLARRGPGSLAGEAHHERVRRPDLQPGLTIGSGLRSI